MDPWKFLSGVSVTQTLEGGTLEREDVAEALCKGLLLSLGLPFPWCKMRSGSGLDPGQTGIFLPLQGLYRSGKSKSSDFHSSRNYEAKT